MQGADQTVAAQSAFVHQGEGMRTNTIEGENAVLRSANDQLTAGDFETVFMPFREIFQRDRGMPQHRHLPPLELGCALARKGGKSFLGVRRVCGETRHRPRLERQLLFERIAVGVGEQSLHLAVSAGRAGSEGGGDLGRGGDQLGIRHDAGDDAALASVACGEHGIQQH